MSIFHKILGGAAGQSGGFAIERSLRFNKADSAYLNRTPSSAGNRKTWTWSGWVKRCGNNTNETIFSAGGSDTNFRTNITVFFYQDDDGTHDARLVVGEGNGAYLRTTARFRDASAWGHLIVVADTTLSTAADRIKIYWNGERITDFNGDTLSTNVPQNSDLGLNTTERHTIGNRSYNNSLANYTNVYLAEINFVDGQALAPADFGEYDDNNIWQPIQYSGTYGTNGYHLDFSDNSSASALGTDAAGSNDWTVNNISVASGAGNDSLLDVPSAGDQSDTGEGGEVSGNYATLNPRGNPYFINNYTLSEGNLKLNQMPSYKYANLPSTIAVSSGKWYCEGTLDSVADASNQVYAGLLRVDAPKSAYEYFQGNAPGSGAMFWGDGNGINRQQSYGSSYATAGTVIGIAFDADNGSCTWYINGSSQGSSTYNIVQGETYYFAFGAYMNGGWTVNFGQREFAYSAPSGYKALCATNLDTPAVANSSDHFDVKLYTGVETANTNITGFNFSPDFVWIKKRNGTTGHFLYDTIRGIRRSLYSNSYESENNYSDTLEAFNSDGFTLGDSGFVNSNNDTYVAYAWEGASSNTSNTDGDVTSTVRANTTAGFSIVSWDPSANGQSVGHGLGKVPEFIMAKARENGHSWRVYHKDLSSTQNLLLDSTDYAQTYTDRIDTVSSTVFDGNGGLTGSSLNDNIAYCFTPVEGFSYFGSWVGNGNTNGPFAYTGFAPRWVLFKRTGGTGYDWYLWDSERGLDKFFKPNLSDSEGTDYFLEQHSNGFEIRKTTNTYNQNGLTYVYAAFAENPFQANGGLAR